MNSVAALVVVEAALAYFRANVVLLVKVFVEVDMDDSMGFLFVLQISLYLPLDCSQDSDLSF